MKCDWCGQEGDIPILGHRDTHYDGGVIEILEDKRAGIDTEPRAYQIACNDCFRSERFRELNPRQTRERKERQSRYDRALLRLSGGSPAC